MAQLPRLPVTDWRYSDMDEMTKLAALLADRSAIEELASQNRRTVEVETEFLLEDPIYRRVVLQNRDADTEAPPAD